MADNAPENRDLMLEEFCKMSGASVETALQYLEANEWNMVNACNSFFTDEDEAKLAERQRKAAEGTLEQYDGPRTLDGRPAPRGDFRSPRPQPKKKGVATLGSMGGPAAGPHHDGDDHDHDHDHDFHSDEDDEGRGDLFAGGEKSGLAVQDPRQSQGSTRKILNDILAKAREAAERHDGDGQNPDPSCSSSFRGTGMTLGGDGVESRAIPDPLGPARPPRGPPQERILHIWKDGFSIDDGELRRFDDPANQMDLKMIRSGRAPLHLMNVGHDQAVDVKLQQHDSLFKAAPKKYKPFSGSGHRLGSPIPGATDAAPPPAAPAPSGLSSVVTPSPSPSSSAAPAVDVDNSQPTLTIRIQLPDGTRLPVRFNTTHTVGDVYGFVRGASPETRTRGWVLATIFPNQEHTDHSQVLGEMPEFKKGGTAVVKWT